MARVEMEDASRGRRSTPAPTRTTVALRPQLPPLVSVAVVCRSHATLAALAPVITLISEFVDTSVYWTIPSASRRETSIPLLRRILARQNQSDPPIDPYHRSQLFALGVKKAASRGNLETVKWLCTEYAPGNVVIEGAYKATEHGHLHVLKWLHEEYGHFHVSNGMVSRALNHPSLCLNPPNDSLGSREKITARLEAIRWLVETVGPGSKRQVVQRQHPHDPLYQRADLWFLQWAVATNLLRSGGDELTHAACAGRLDVVQWFASHLDQVYRQQQGRTSGVTSVSREDDDGCRFDDDVSSDGDVVGPFSFPYSIDMAGVMKAGHLDIIEWLDEADFPWLEASDFSWLQMESVPNTMDKAARAGNLELVQYLHTLHAEGSANSAMDEAAAGGHLHIVRWLHENRSEGCTIRAMDEAASNGHMDVLQWLHENRTEGCSTWAMDAAAIKGKFDVVRWLHEHRTEGCTTLTMDSAARYGRLDVVQWLHESRNEGCTTEAMDTAALLGRLDVVKWLHVHRKEGCSDRAIVGVASAGHLDVLKYLFEVGHGLWTPEVMDQAIAYNRVDTVRWLSEHRTEGCSRWAIARAAMEGNLPMVQWLSINYADRFTQSVMNSAAQYGKLEVVKWLHNNRLEGCTTDAMDLAATSGKLAMVEWLHYNRSEGCTTNAMDGAACHGHFEVALFLHRHRSEGCSAYAFQYTYTHNQLSMLQWLASVYPSQFDREYLLGLVGVVVADYMEEWVRDGKVATSLDV